MKALVKAHAKPGLRANYPGPIRRTARLKAGMTGVIQ
jgi:hypothetical protein